MEGFLEHQFPVESHAFFALVLVALMLKSTEASLALPVWFGLTMSLGCEYSRSPWKRLGCCYSGPPVVTSQGTLGVTHWTLSAPAQDSSVGAERGYDYPGSLWKKGYTSGIGTSGHCH